MLVPDTHTSVALMDAIVVEASRGRGHLGISRRERSFRHRVLHRASALGQICGFWCHG